MSTVDDLLDFGAVESKEKTETDAFGDIAWQPSSNADLLAEFDMSTTKTEDNPFGDFGNQEQEGNTNNLDDSDDPFASVKLESSDSLLKDFGFDSELLSGDSSNNPFGDKDPFGSSPPDAEPAETQAEITSELDEPTAEETPEIVKPADESDDDDGPQVSSAIDDQVYSQDSSSEEEQNFNTIRPFKPTPAKRPSTSAVTPETHEEEDETAGQLVEEEEEPEEEEEEEEPKVEEKEELVEEEEEEEEEKEEEIAEDTTNGTAHEDDSNVEAFLNSRNQRFDEESSDRAEEEPQDGTGFAYEGHVFQQEKLRDPSPELRESSRYVSDTTATFDHPSEAQVSRTAVDSISVEKNWNLDVRSLVNNYRPASPPQVITPERRRSSQPFNVQNDYGGSDEMCRSCGKRVYQMERLIADKHVYHKMCFKCSKCRSILSIGNFAVNNNELYCKPHFMELFKYRGRYDDNPDAPSTSNGYSPPMPVREKRETRVTEEVPAGDVIRGEDSVDDGISSGPRLSNLRSRFEVTDTKEQAPPKEAPPRQTRQWKYQQKEQSAPEADERRSSEPRREEELPPQNMARTLAAKFREMESSTDGPPMPRMSPRTERRQTEEMTQRQVVAAERSERSPSIGSPTSESNNIGENELPPPDTTRSMAAIFRALESQGGPPPTPDCATRIQAKAREQSGANNTVRMPAAGRQYPPEDMYEVERSNGNGVHAENEPLELDPSVIRNDEPPPTEELPERGTTRNLVAMFKSMEAN